MAAIIRLVKSFAWIKMRQRLQLRDERCVPYVGDADFAHHFLRYGFLTCIVVKNDRPVLCAAIIALTVERRGVVNGEKYFQ